MGKSLRPYPSPSQQCSLSQAEKSVIEAEDFLLTLKSSSDEEEFEGFNSDDEEQYRNNSDPFEDWYVYYFTVMRVSHFGGQSLFFYREVSLLPVPSAPSPQQPPAPLRVTTSRRATFAPPPPAQPAKRSRAHSI